MSGVHAEQVTLRDGRTLAVTVAGPDGGTPLVYHHGTPGGGRQQRSIAADTAARGLRYVTYARAGAEGSTRNWGRSVADVAADIEDVLDWLGADRCLVAGKSGGGPHALATGALLPQRVAAVISIAGAAPYGEHFLDGMGADNVVEFNLALQGEEALLPFVRKEQAAMLDADAEHMVAELDSLLPEVDRAVFRSPAGVDIVEELREGVREIYGWVDDDLAFTRHWGFELGDLAVPTYIWQGSADLMVPFHHGQQLAAQIPGAVAHLEPGEGHFSIAVGAMGRMLDEAMQHL